MTTVKLLNVPFESNYKDTVWFPRSENNQFNIQAQTDYMLAREVRSFSDFSYQRKDNIIRVPVHIDTLYNCNYVMYKNDIYPNKWFYAFIIDMKYVNEERTDIIIQTDVMQTWWFDYKVQPSFVEREHVDDDTIGLHTVPEMLETGEYVCDRKIDKASIGDTSDAYIIVGTTIDLSKWTKTNDGLNYFGGGDFPTTSGKSYNGVYSGLEYFAFTDMNILQTVLATVADEGQIDGIHSIFMCPKPLVSITSSGTDWGLYRVTSANNPVKIEVSSTELPVKPTSINGYTNVRNNKLFTYPYCYLLVSNNSGGANTYRYELFDSIGFNIYGAVTPGMSVRLIPQNYGGVAENNNEGLTLGKFPICSWASDVYTNWLTQNAVNVGVDIGSGIVQIVAGLGMSVGTGGAGGVLGAGSVASGIHSIGNSVGQIYQHSMIPPAINGNINSGDVTFSKGLLTFTFYQMNIKKEYAEIIDNYFDMFGYKVNRVKVPNENHRFSYWYTKTIDVNIDGAIPNKDLEQIKQNYNNGITFWEHSSKMGDYSQDNHIYKGI